MVKVVVGAVRRAGDGADTEHPADWGGYSHLRPMRLQWVHSGSISWHFTLRLLQLKQP
jgi:hypothetical protein